MLWFAGRVRPSFPIPLIAIAPERASTGSGIQQNTMNNYDSIKMSLQSKLNELTVRAAEIEDDLSDRGDSDWAENAIESEDDEVLTGLAKATIHDIHEIKLALNRIDAGKYGICTSCGNKIPKLRLDVIPFATTCVNCA